MDGVTANIGSGETPSIIEIARFISERMGVPIVHEKPRPGEVPGFFLDSTYARSLGYEPKVRFWDGLDAYLRLWESS